MAIPPLNLKLKPPPEIVIDMKFWERDYSVSDVNTGQGYSSTKWAALCAKSSDLANRLGPKKQFQKACVYCSVPLVGSPTGEDTYACKCYRHKNCMNMLAPAQLGKCKQQEHCIRCCKCQICSKCNVFFKVRVRKNQFLFGHSKPMLDPMCGLCKACCKCKPCINCGKNTPTEALCQCLIGAAGMSAHHADCCDSNKRLSYIGNRLMFLPRIPRFHAGSNFQHCRSRRFMANELELVGFSNSSKLQSLNTVLRDWGCAIVTDQSLPRDTGGEINTAPASGDKFLREMYEIAGALGAAGAMTDWRCGMHTHVDARDFTYPFLVNLIQVYYKVEPALFAMMPPSRRINRFCLPCRDHLLEIAKGGNKIVDSIRKQELATFTRDQALMADTKKKPSIALQLAQRMYGDTVGGIRKAKSTKSARDRYWALNIHSWVHRRTIEFRHWPGSTDAKEMILWPQVLAAIMDFAKQTPLESVGRRPSIKRLSSNPIEALLQVCAKRSWVGGEVGRFVEERIALHSPDFNVVWELLRASNQKNLVVPFKDYSLAHEMLSFNEANGYFTYVNEQYMRDPRRWGEPLAIAGRYAELVDLYVLPSSAGKLKNLHPTPPSPFTKPKKPSVRDDQ